MLARMLALAVALALPAPALAACCYFSAQDKDVNQPAQKAFITWEPKEKAETFTVQPKFEGDARDFGMVIPTPSKPKLDEMPRDFFKHLALYTILLPLPQKIDDPVEALVERMTKYAMAPRSAGIAFKAKNGHGVTVLESGVVGSLDYKILEATDPRGLYRWLDENKYKYAGDAKTLGYYIDQKWIFTVMKIDAKQMKPTASGGFAGEVTPTRFAFASDKLVYPLKITQISVKDATEAIFYVQAPTQVDLKDSWSWKWSYRVMWLRSGTVCLSQKQMTEAEQHELEERERKIAQIKQEIPGYDTTKLEWAGKLSGKQVEVLDDPVGRWGQGGFPDLPPEARETTLDEMRATFRTRAQANEQARRESYLESFLKNLERFSEKNGALVKIPGPSGKDDYYFFKPRTAPEPDVAALSQLKGHLKSDRYLTKFRKIFLKHEMNQDLEMVDVEGSPVEYLRLLPQSPP